MKGKTRWCHWFGLFELSTGACAVKLTVKRFNYSAES